MRSTLPVCGISVKNLGNRGTRTLSSSRPLALILVLQSLAFRSSCKGYQQVLGAGLAR